MQSGEKGIDIFGLPLDRKYSLCGLPIHKKYRSHFEIIALVLEAMKAQSATTFAIMKHASINCIQLKKYLKSLIEIGFVEMEIRKGRMSYKTSVEGLEFLRQYSVLLDMLSSTRVRNRILAPYAKDAVSPLIRDS